MSKQTKRRAVEQTAMPANYPVVTAEQAGADGTEPWTLRVIANRIGRAYPRHAHHLRRVAAQLAADNDNRARRVA